MTKKTNVIVILNDDMGYSDIGCYGGEMDTPNLDSLARRGLRYTQFYNTARCCPTRASLLTGLHPHQANIGHMMGDDGIDGYRGDLSRETVTIAEVLKLSGYSTYMSGKWHVANDRENPGNWPCQRGFDDFYGIITGAASYFNPSTLTRNNTRVEPEGDEYYFTDVVSDEAVRQIKQHAASNSDAPFFQYIAYTAPHWPLHAYPEDIKKYEGRFDRGWDKLREERYERMVDMGIIDPQWKLADRAPSQPPWEEADNKEWQARRMEVYAAQIDRMDQGIGRVIDALKIIGEIDNTLIFFLSDNGGCAEELTPEWTFLQIKKTRDGREVQLGNDPSVMPGPEDTYQSYGVPWANVSDTPFRKYKHWVHEGGIATPLIVHWPHGIEAQNELRHHPAQLPHIMATIVDVTGAQYPLEYDGHVIPPMEGQSMVSTFVNEDMPDHDLYWEHEGNCAIRRGKWKLVKEYANDWELYNMETDRTEIYDIADDKPPVVQELKASYEAWAERCNVMPWERLQQMRRSHTPNEP